MLFQAKFKERNHFEVFKDIVIGLFLRESKQKFGKYSFGMAWAFLEPVAHIATFSFILLVARNSDLDPALIPIFVLTGIIPFVLFRQTSKQIMNSATANLGAFTYPIVNPFHAVCARWLFETFIYVTSFFIIFAAIMYFFEVPKLDINVLEALTVTTLLSFAATGLGMLLMVAKTFYPSIEKIINLIFRPLYFLSGIFYAAAQIPEEYYYIFEWNPIFHAIELMREAILSQKAMLGDISYLFICSAVLFLFGLMAYNTHYERLKRK